MDRTGKVEAVVIGVGGFLGIGEKSVAVPFNEIKFADQPGGGRVGTVASPTAPANPNAPANTNTNTRAGRRPHGRMRAPRRGATRTTP